MHRRTVVRSLALGTLAIGLPRHRMVAAQPRPDPKQQVVDLLKSIETRDPAPMAVIDPHHYTEHNLAVPDGVDGFVGLLKQRPAGSARIKTIRVFQDDDHVFAHSEYTVVGPKIGFDIFRFEDGLIVEHWDNLQARPDTPNASGHTMTDGPTNATDLDKTAANKAVVRGFVEDVLVHGRLDRVPAYIDATTYIQHNPHVPDGAAAMIAAFRRLNAQGTPHRYHHVHKVLGCGNFVLTASEGVAGQTPTAFYDLFRVAHGRIVEHWDTLETIPPRSDWKNPNGKF